MRWLFAPLLVALSFLTLAPVGLSTATDREISRSRGWYPLVGLLYGLALVGVAELCRWFRIEAPLTAALLVATLAVANRFLHLDGLMDVCDGVWGGRTVERRLEIMRDSRVGAFAVAGAGCVMLVKYGALTTLLAVDGTVWPSLVVFPVVSRWTMTLLLTVFPYGRQQGIGTAFTSGGKPWLATGLALLTAGIVAVGAGWFAGLIVLAIGSALALLAGLWLTKKLGGGLTGDCYGAVNEIVESATLIVLVALLAQGRFGLGFAWFGQVAG